MQKIVFPQSHWLLNSRINSNLASNSKAFILIFRWFAAAMSHARFPVGNSIPSCHMLACWHFSTAFPTSTQALSLLLQEVETIYFVRSIQGSSIHSLSSTHLKFKAKWNLNQYHWVLCYGTQFQHRIWVVIMYHLK